MAKEERTIDSKVLRHLLDTFFSDDVALTTFCMDNYPKIKLQFGEGMRHDEKINLLLNNCLNLASKRAALLAHIKAKVPDEEFKEALRNAEGEEPRKILLVSDLIRPHRFDLTKLIERITEELVTKDSGLIGFGIPYDGHTFLEQLCKRLQDEWPAIKNHYPLKVDPLYGPIEAVIKTVEMQQHNLKIGDVLFVVTGQVNDLSEFWQRLYLKFGDEKLSHRLLVIMALSSGVARLDVTELIWLDPPRFEKSHIYLWIREVVRCLDWPENTIDAWYKYMLASCCLNGNLFIDSTYIYLEQVGPLLQEYSTPDCFLAAVNPGGL